MNFKILTFLMGFVFLNTICIADSDLSSKINSYFPLLEKPEAKIKQFQTDFINALKNPSHLNEIGKIYTDGFRNDISYSEQGPSFVAFVELHQALFEYMKEAPPAIARDFKTASDNFTTRVSKLASQQNIEVYEDKLNDLYKDFLVQFMKKHQAFFKEYFLNSIHSFTGSYGAEMDTIACAFFALQEGWPGFETNDRKYQFEKLYVWRFEDGRNVLILGYNKREQACNKALHIYTWDPETPGSIPTQVKNGDMNFDLSPQMYQGGCSSPADVPWVINFDSPILRFYGYDNAEFRYYIYNVLTKEWKITTVPRAVEEKRYSCTS